MAELIFFLQHFICKLLSDSRSFLGLEPANKPVVSNPIDTSTHQVKKRVNVVGEVESP